VPNLIDELGTAEERRMNQLSTAEFGAAKVRHKFGRACRIMRRWSDIDSYAALLMYHANLTQLWSKNKLIYFEFY
jgi:hypothetical protein